MRTSTLHVLSDATNPDLAAPVTADLQYTSDRYVRIPLVHACGSADVATGNAQTVIYFEGTLDVFEGGALRFIGNLRLGVAIGTTDAIGYRVWVGASPSVGAFVEIGSAQWIAGVSTIVPVDVLVQPGAGESVYLVFGHMGYGATVNDAKPSKVLAVEYPTGLKQALAIPIAYTNNGLTVDGFARVNDWNLAIAAGLVDVTAEFRDVGAGAQLGFAQHYYTEIDPVLVYPGSGTFANVAHGPTDQNGDYDQSALGIPVPADPLLGIVFRCELNTFGSNAPGAHLQLGPFTLATWPINRRVLP